MKNYLPLSCYYLWCGLCRGMSTRHQSSLQLTVEPQIVTQTRIGNSYSILKQRDHNTYTAASGSSAVDGIGITTDSATTGVEQLEQLLVFKMDAQDHLQMMT